MAGEIARSNCQTDHLARTDSAGKPPREIIGELKRKLAESPDCNAGLSAQLRPRPFSNTTSRQPGQPPLSLPRAGRQPKFLKARPWYRNESPIMSSPIERINIQATNRPALEEQLNGAIRQLQELAIVTKTHGILLTRHRHNHYTAALTDRVPFGLTHELDQ